MKTETMKKRRETLKRRNEHSKNEEGNIDKKQERLH